MPDAETVKKFNNTKDLRILLRVCNTYLLAREKRLIACACIRLLWPLLTEALGRECVRAAEQLADGLITLSEFQQRRMGFRKLEMYMPHYARTMHLKVVSSNAEDAITQVVHAVSEYTPKHKQTINLKPKVLECIRCITGPMPMYHNFTPAIKYDSNFGDEELCTCGHVYYRHFDSYDDMQPVGCKYCNCRSGFFPQRYALWEGNTVLNMANDIYIHLSWDRMPILGDALEEAGCTEKSVLDHCRQPGQHGRGCWVVDAITNRRAYGGR